MKRHKFLIDRKSWWYKNCKRQRKVGAKICQECPFRGYIDNEEKNQDSK